MPFKLSYNVEAILELVLFKLFESHKIDFINQIGGSVFSKISTIKIDQRTKALLEKLQIQVEELVAQKAEMRQYMEEFQTGNEEMS